MIRILIKNTNKSLQDKEEKSGGFTLLELLAVLVILAALATIAVVVFANKGNESKEQANKHNIQILQKQALAYLLSLDTMPAEDTDISNNLVTAGFIKEIPPYPLGDGSYKVVMNSDSTASVIVPANAPVLSAGMTPVKWNGSAWVTADSKNTNNDWYKYNGDLDNSADADKNDGVVTEVDAKEEKWANVKLAEDSMFVWIPRFSYKITSNEHTISATGGRIKIKYSAGTSDENIGGYRTHPAFTLGTSQLTGIWVAKFEASPRSPAVPGNATGTDNVTTRQVQIKPDASSWRYIYIGKAFQVCRNMETDSAYGWGTSGIGVDSHLMKNIEWGAVAYLAEAIRDGEEIWINNYSLGVDTKTGMSATTVGGGKSASTSSTANSRYNIEDDKITALTGPSYSGGGARASTTGNIYGVYDMAGGSYEYISAYLENAHTYIAQGGLTMQDAANAKYVDKYTADTVNDNSTAWSDQSSGTEQEKATRAEIATLGNYNNLASKYGDALYETSYKPSWNSITVFAWWYYGGANTTAGSGGTKGIISRGWYDDYVLGGWATLPFLNRGGAYDDGSGSGSFAFLSVNGGTGSQGGFRPALAIGVLD